MKYFLTSSPCIQGQRAFNPENQFIDELLRQVPKQCRATFICSDPIRYDFNDHIANDMLVCFQQIGIDFITFDIIDDRNAHIASELILGRDLLIFAGGHVPTQNAFFNKIHLKNILNDYDQVIMGISAGAMNCSSLVYAIPEACGEAIDPHYQRFIHGLGITDTILIPHYNQLKGSFVDSLLMFEEIAIPDSLNHRFYTLMDGSYIYGDGTIEEVRGECYLIEKQTVRLLIKNKEVYEIKNALEK